MDGDDFPRFFLRPNLKDGNTLLIDLRYELNNLLRASPRRLISVTCVTIRMDNGNAVYAFALESNPSFPGRSQSNAVSNDL
jgi:hypothetical protein